MLYETDYEARLRVKTQGVRLKDSVAIVLREPYDGSEFEGITDEEAKEVWEVCELLGVVFTPEMSWLDIRVQFYDKYEMLNDAREEFGTQHSLRRLFELMFGDEEGTK